MTVYEGANKSTQAHRMSRTAQTVIPNIRRKEALHASIVSWRGQIMGLL